MDTLSLIKAKIKAKIDVEFCISVNATNSEDQHYFAYWRLYNHGVCGEDWCIPRYVESNRSTEEVIVELVKYYDKGYNLKFNYGERTFPLDQQIYDRIKNSEILKVEDHPYFKDIDKLLEPAQSYDWLKTQQDIRDKLNNIKSESLFKTNEWKQLYSKYCFAMEKLLLHLDFQIENSPELFRYVILPLENRKTFCYTNGVVNMIRRGSM
jgi:hypothetical protein